MFSSRFLRIAPAVRGLNHSAAHRFFAPTSLQHRISIAKTPRLLTRELQNFSSPSPPPRPTPRRRAALRYDVQRASGAKPLITPEQLRNTIRSPQGAGIIILVVGSGLVFYVSNLETVPISGRRRFNCYSEESVEAEGLALFRKILQSAIDQNALLPASDRRSRAVARVMERLITASGLDHVDWEVHVIHSPEKNAFVIPGGKVFVYSGILPVCRNDDGLAAVLGHEIAHNLAQHQAENLSSFVLLTPLRWVLYSLDAAGITMGLGRILGEFALDLGIMRPGSRKQESEADYIGLMMMAKACYDPEAAIGLWQRMEQQDDQAGPEWLSTHPTNLNRADQIRGWLAKARLERNDGECGPTISHHQHFQSIMQDMENGIGSAFWR
ncbi:peptidase family M48 [Phlyctema vagabunda]|uniref:Peptidase family M48 n=1 Tax=Phlyctema vagabunda TaxID=108571 RepID=A0ABR4PLN8_9HELO